jgi:uncharacterized protein YqgC (DUF456 family)
MKNLRQKIVSVGILLAGILLTVIGLAGLFLPIIPGFLLIFLGLWTIGKVYKHPHLDRLLDYVKRKKDGILKK